MNLWEVENNPEFRILDNNFLGIFIFIDMLHSGIGFNPDFCSTIQRAIWLINDSTATVDYRVTRYA